MIGRIFVAAYVTVFVPMIILGIAGVISESAFENFLEYGFGLPLLVLFLGVTGHGLWYWAITGRSPKWLEPYGGLGGGI